MSGDRPQEHQPTPDQASQLLALTDAQTQAPQAGPGGGTAMSLDSLLASNAGTSNQGYGSTRNDDPHASSTTWEGTGTGQSTRAPDLTPFGGDSTSQSPQTAQADTGNLANAADAAGWVGSGTGMPLDFLQALPAQPDQPPVAAQDQPGNTDSAGDTDNQPIKQRTDPPDNLSPLAPEHPGFEPAHKTWTENQIERAAREPGRNEEGKNNEQDRLQHPPAKDRESKGRQGDRPRTPEEKGNEIKGARDAADIASDHPRNSSLDKNGTADRLVSPSAGNRENNPRGKAAEVTDRSSRSPESHPIESLRDYLRQPENRTTATDKQSRHKAAMSNIWDRALTLTHDDPLAALTVATEAVKSGRQPGETKAEYTARLDGVPSLAFGTGAPNAGVDKPQHFYATARESLAAAIGTMDYDPISRSWSPPMTGIGEVYGNIVGRLYEVKDGITGLWSRTGGYDSGDVHADDLGAAFGAALASQFATPDQLRPGATLPRISDYLK